MFNRKVVQLGVVSIFTAIIMSACGQDDNRDNSSRFVEVNNVCFNRDNDREVSRHKCDDDNAERFYVQNNRCYKYSNDREVDMDNCDPLYRDSGYGWNNGLYNNYGSRCTGIMYMPGGYQVDCSRYSCQGLYMMDSNFRSVYCQ